MAILATGNTFVTGDQVTAATLNTAVNSATFASGAVDSSTTQLSSGAIIVKDGGITGAKLASNIVISTSGTITSTATAGALILSGATTINRRLDIGNTGQTTNIGVDSSTGGAAIGGGAAYSTFINSGAATSPVQIGVNGVLIGNFTSTTFISSVPIRLKNYTVATLPAGTQGDTAFVTDALAPTFLTALTGGGAVVTPAFYNGTAWVSY